MNTKFIEAREHLNNAREALRRGDKETARQLGEKAALLAPEMEDAWLVLAASDPDPEEALAYAKKALEVNPESMRARRGVEWAKEQVKQLPVKSEPLRGMGNESSVIKPIVKSTPQKINPPIKAKSNKRVWVYTGVFGLLACAVLGFAAWSAVTSPAFASISASAPTQENLWAQVEIAKPEVVPLKVSLATDPQVAVTSTPSPVNEVTALPTSTSTPVEESANILPSVVPSTTPPPEDSVSPLPTVEEPVITETPGAMAMNIVADTPTSEYIPPPTSQAPKPAVASAGNGGRWIDVNLSNQSVYAYEGDAVVNSFIVSTGTWQYPTVTGQYKVYVKYRYANMSGPGYFLPDVPYVMYFYGSYGLHGTYWHHNFGTPMSHGCVNLSIDDAGWLYNWASVGTVVNVHY